MTPSRRTIAFTLGKAILALPSALYAQHVSLDLDAFPPPAVTSQVVLKDAQQHLGTPDLVGTWTRVTSPTTDSLKEISMIDAQDGWAVGGIIDLGSGGRGTILRCSNGQWTAMQNPATDQIASVCALSPSDVWAVGRSGQILHYNGAQWALITSPTSEWLTDVDMVSASDGWVVSLDGDILRYNGTSWSQFARVSGDLLSVKMISSQEGYAAGWNGALYHFNGTTWQVVSSPSSDRFKDIDFVSPTDGWLVGEADPVIAHYDGTDWSVVPNPSGQPIYGIDMLSPTDGWAVGKDGTILHYDGSFWHLTASPVLSWLTDVCMATPNEGWAVGSGGTLLHYTNGSSPLSDLRASQRPGTHLVDVYYNLAGPASCSINMMLSSDGGSRWDVFVTTLSGDIGAAIAPGLDRHVIWDSGADWPNQQSPSMVVRLSTTGASADSAPFPVNTLGVASWTLRAWADKNDNHVYDTGEGIAGAEVYYDGRTDAHRDGTTGPDGTFQVTEAIRQGAQVFVRKVIYEEPAVKNGHAWVNNNMYSLWIDSDGAWSDQDEGDGTWHSRIITASDIADAQSSTPVSVVLSHPVFEWNLVVATEVSSSTFLEQLQDGFESASEYLYDVTDGQMKFGNVAIYGNVTQGSETWNNADMVIFSDADYGPNAHVNGIRDGGGWFGTKHMFFGTDWTGWGADDPSDSDYFRTIVHEFGHYALDLYDEYIDGWGSKANWDAYRANHPDEVPANYGLMDHQYNVSEMSSFNDYLSSYGLFVWGHEITKELMQHDLFWGFGWYPCWQWVEANYEKTYNGIPVEIVVPPSGSFPNDISEDRSGPTTIPEPYSLCEFPLVHVQSRQVQATSEPLTSVAPSTEPVRIETRTAGIPACGAYVLRKPKGVSRIYALGRTDASGFLPAWDVGVGDILVARLQGVEAEQLVRVDDLPGPIRINISPPVAPLVRKGLRTLSGGDLGLLVSAIVEAGPTNILALRIHANEPLTASPTVTAHLDDGPAITVPVAHAGGNIWTGAVDFGTSVGGTFEISCDSTNGQHVSCTDQFSLGPLYTNAFAVLYSRDGWTEAHLQPGSAPMNCAGVLYSCYSPTIFPDGFGKLPVGPVTFACLGANEGLNGTTGVVNFTYREADIVGVDETTIQLYRLNAPRDAWEQVPATLSVDQNVVSATITNLGLLALFADATVDVTGPAQIADLNAATGTNGWTVDLAWTDVGDDGLTGQATAYVLKYSTTEIVETNWGACTKHDLGIVPATSGTPRSCSIQMPDPGVRYFFGIEAQDEAGNCGPLSIIAQAQSHAYDADGDLMSDQWEHTYGLNPTNALDAVEDADGDGLSNLEEAGLGTNPTSWDSDGDGMGDKWETDHGLDPLSTEDRTGDADGDGLLNHQEHEHFTDPNNPDTDGDGMPDKWELDNGLNPLTTAGDHGASADADGDTVPNVSEYAADTVPTNRSSFLGISGIEISGGSAVLHWHGGVLATQWVERSQSLTSTGGTWVTVLTNLPPTSVSSNWTDEIENEMPIFYRIKAVR